MEIKFKSTNGRIGGVGLKEALLQGFAEDGGLFLPEAYPQVSLELLQNTSFPETSLLLAELLFKGELKKKEIEELVHQSFTFPLPMRLFEENVCGMELFHGPTLSFKDIGARFLAALISQLLSPEEQVTVLVATSGDTGSAVGRAFYQIPQTQVVILYAKGRVSEIQEKQLTTIGGNVFAVEVDGTFDDCQRLLKQALFDRELQKKRRMTTGNSINIGRLLPQSFYYFYAYNQLPRKILPITFSVPCGNFGHLVSGLIAKRMGLPVTRFIAATNVNDEVPIFLKCGHFTPRPSISTIASSMDVGNPSNFPRLLELYERDLDKMRSEILGYSFTNDEIVAMVQEVYNKTHYILDPHSAVAYFGLKHCCAVEKKNGTGLFFITAHPAKFLEAVQPLIPQKIPLPAPLQRALLGEKRATTLSSDYSEFKEFLLTL